MHRRIVRGMSTSVAVGLCVSASLQAAPSTLLDAAKERDIATVRELLKEGDDVNAASGDGMTALHWTALNDDVELAKVLLHAGANLKATTRLGGYTPLLIASKTGSIGVVQTLLAAGANPNTATTNGTTALMLAAASGHLPAVTMLLDRGASMNAADSGKGGTALTFAAASGRTDVIRLLTTRGADTTIVTKVVDLYELTRDEPPVPTAPGTSSTPEPGAAAARGRDRDVPKIAGVTRRFTLSELVGLQGGLTPLLIAARQGHLDAADALLDAGADVNQPSGGDRTTPLLIATVNGHFDLASMLLQRGAEPNLASENGVTPLYAVLNCRWAPKAAYPQPRAFEQQKTSHLDLITQLLDKGADPNVRIKKKVWYSNYNHDLSGVDETGATPFWRAAYASDVDAMRLLVARGADPSIPTMKGVGRPPVENVTREFTEVASQPPVPLGGPALPPLQAAAGAGYGEGSAGNSHRFAPTGMLAAVKYLVEELHADVNARDHEGNTALHCAAARGDNEMILYLVSKGANVRAVNREGKTTADMANGPVQRIQPFPETIALLEKLGAKNNHRCVSC
jgi:uncharacterized protein